MKESSTLQRSLTGRKCHGLEAFPRWNSAEFALELASDHKVFSCEGVPAETPLSFNEVNDCCYVFCDSIINKGGTASFRPFLGRRLFLLPEAGKSCSNRAKRFRIDKGGNAHAGSSARTEGGGAEEGRGR